MQKVILDLIQIAIVVRMGYSLIKWAFGSTKRHKKSIVGKIMKLVSNRIHYHLDNALKKQKEAFYPSAEYGKVIPFRKTK